eukprot:s652_g18.t1
MGVQKNRMARLQIVCVWACVGGSQGQGRRKQSERPLCLACPLDSPPSISMIGGSLCTDSTSRCPPFQRPPTPELTLGTWFACAARQPARACRGDGCGADWCGVAAGLFALRVGGDSFLFLPFLLLLLDL